MEICIRTFRIAVLLAIATLRVAHADIVTYEWAQRFGDTAGDQGTALALDRDRNVYTTGYFQHTVDFDSGAGVRELTSYGEVDIFILKKNSDGKFVWVRQIGSSDTEISNRIVLDADGNIYVVGSFYGTTDFDPGPGTANLTAKGQPDTFILKLDKKGSFVWVKHLRGKNDTGLIISLALAIDGNGNVYIPGYFTDTGDFDPGDDKANLTSVGSFDVFLLKLRSDGSFVWVKQIGGSSNDFSSDLVVDLDGYLYLCGAFNGSLDLDPGANIDVVTSAGQEDIFILKLDLNGNHIWSHAYGSGGQDIARFVGLDTSGNIVMTGDYYGTVQFGVSDTLTSQGENDVFLVKLSHDESTGSLWATSMGGPDADKPFAFTMDEDGNAYVGGLFFDTASFGIGKAEVQYTSKGEGDIFEAKYAANGSLEWAVAIGGEEHDICKGLAVDRVGNLYGTGYFTNSVVFDPFPSFLAPLISSGESDIFVSKLNFIPNGSVKVKLKPKAVRQAGAAWRIDNAPPWRKHNELLNDVSIGQHTVQFKSVPGKKTPATKAITVDANEIETLSGKYKASR